MTWLDALFIVIATLIGVGFGYHLRTLNLAKDRRKEGVPRTEVPNPATDTTLETPPQHSAEEAARRRAAHIRQGGDATTHLPPGTRPTVAGLDGPTRRVSVHSATAPPEEIELGAEQTLLTHTRFAGLASSLTLRMVDDTIMVRAGGEGSYLVIDDVQIPITRIEIPWRNGHLSSGLLTIGTVHPTQRPTLQASVPDGTPLHTLAQGNWLVVAEHRATVVAAAQLFVPQNLDPVGSWQERLLAYQATTGHALPGKASLVWMPPDQIEVGGTLVSQVGLAREGDNFAGIVEEVPFSETLNGPSRLDQVWLRVGEHWGADDCIVVRRQR